MAEAIQEVINLEEFKMKEETVFMEKEILPSSKNTCSVYVQEEDGKGSKMATNILLIY